MTDNSDAGFKKDESAKTNTPNDSMQASQLMKLFEDELKDIFWTEKILVKAIPKMIQNATSVELIHALLANLAETNVQVGRLAKVFASIENKPMANKSEGMDGLLKEAEEIMKTTETGAMCDAGIISAAQKIEHFEIASYSTLHQFAESLGLDEVVTLLAKTLKEEKAADEKLSEVAVLTNNIAAADPEA